jgi:hypothetical protein
VTTEGTPNTKVVEDLLDFPTSGQTPDSGSEWDTYDYRKWIVSSDMSLGEVGLMTA